MVSVLRSRKGSKGLVSRSKPEMVIAVCEPGSDSYSETFIRSHIERLPGTIVDIHGGWPLWESQGRRIIPLAYRTTWLLRMKLPPAWSALAERRASLAMSRLLRDRGVQVALADMDLSPFRCYLSAGRQVCPLLRTFMGSMPIITTS